MYCLYFGFLERSFTKVDGEGCLINFFTNFLPTNPVRPVTRTLIDLLVASLADRVYSSAKEVISSGKDTHAQIDSTL